MNELVNESLIYSHKNTQSFAFIDRIDSLLVQKGEFLNFKEKRHCEFA